MILPNNPYVAVLDACVLLPMPLCDTLLRLAEEPFPLYQVRWTGQILAEVQRNFVRLRPAAGRSPAAPQLAEKRIRQMRGAFPDAMVDGFEGLIPAMCNHTKDRHVLAAAMHGQAHAIVTDNAKDFPAECVGRFGVDVRSSDQFLVDQFHLNPDLVLDKLRHQAAVIGFSLDGLVLKLAERCPEFCALVREAR